MTIPPDGSRADRYALVTDAATSSVPHTMKCLATAAGSVLDIKRASYGVALDRVTPGTSFSANDLRGTAFQLA